QGRVGHGPTPSGDRNSAGPRKPRRPALDPVHGPSGAASGAEAARILSAHTVEPPRLSCSQRSGGIGMGWWQKLFGKSQEGKSKAAACGPAILQLLPGKLSARVYTHA